ncbi:MAG: alpha/beta hydrolase [Chloroflexaceae bacterium]|jgi:3-oxoadipate enol-lactonase|nr:alpha/beta hydrolase [Chloroflexaceae bacterium]
MHTTVNGISLFYRDEGAGPVVLLVHAFPLNGAMWESQVAALRGSYRVLVPDLRGFGQSQVTDGPTHMATMADDLVALLDSLGVAQVVLAGLSMGGYVGMAFARTHAGRLRGLVLADTRAGVDSPEAQAARETNAQLAEREGVAALADKMLPNLLAPAAPPELHAQLKAIAMGNQPAGVAAALRGMALRDDSTGFLPQINVPTLIIVGSADKTTPPSEARAMHAAIPGSHMVEIADAGHLSNVEQPEAFNAALLGFLKR